MKVGSLGAVGSREALSAALGDASQWDDGVKSLIKWQIGLHGDFKEALWRAISTADANNLALLSKGFPLECAAFVKWLQGDLATTLREAGLEL